jgi:xanthine/uracil permease
MASVRSALFRLLLLGINIVLVILLFQMIPEKKVAATIAGFTFIGTSSALFWLSFCGTRIPKAFTPWVAGGFLILVAIPMVAVRLLNWSMEFTDLSVWGIPGQEFHQLGSRLFLLQPLAVILDAAIEFLKQKKKNPKH